jgi:hypothetical protein
MTHWMTPKQRLTLMILAFIFAPGFMAIISEAAGLRDFGEGLTALLGFLMPIGIVWSVFRYKAEMRRLRQPPPPPPPPQSIQPPIQPAQTALPPQSYQPPISPPPTNPIAAPQRWSVTEDETQQLPGQKK